MKPNTSWQTNGRHRQGLSVVETAIMLPILILLTLACIDFGRVFHFRQVVCNAARAGAQQGATIRFNERTRQQWQDSVESTVYRELENIPGYRPDLANVSVSLEADRDDVAGVSVEASYPFRTVVSWPGLSETVPIEHRVFFRQFR